MCQRGTSFGQRQKAGLKWLIRLLIVLAKNQLSITSRSHQIFVFPLLALPGSPPSTLHRSWRRWLPSPTMVSSRLLSVRLLVFSSLCLNLLPAFEVSDPRFRDRPPDASHLSSSLSVAAVGPDGELTQSPSQEQQEVQQQSTDSWKVVDIHWLEIGLLNVVRFNGQDTYFIPSFSDTSSSSSLDSLPILQVNISSSYDSWPVGPDECPFPSPSCVSIPYVVNRVSKCLLLDVSLLLSSSPSTSVLYVDSSVDELCRIEDLHETNCLHYKTLVHGAVKQQRERKSGLLSLLVDGFLQKRWSHPFPPYLSLPSLSPGLHELSVELEGHAGHATGKKAGTPTKAGRSLVVAPRTCEVRDYELAIVSPSRGGRYLPAVAFEFEVNSLLSYSDSSRYYSSVCLHLDSYGPSPFFQCLSLPLPSSTEPVRRKQQYAFPSIPPLPAGRHDVRLSYSVSGGGGGNDGGVAGSHQADCPGLYSSFSVYEEVFTVSYDDDESSPLDPPPAVARTFSLEFEAGWKADGLNVGDPNGVVEKLMEAVPGLTAAAAAVGARPPASLVEGVGGEQQQQHVQALSRTSKLEVELLSLSHRLLFRGSDWTVVTACSTEYVLDGRLSNLVGSLHYWESGVPIVVYGVGLTPDVEATINSWKDVTLRHLPDVVNTNGIDPFPTPAHLHVARSYAFKALVLSDAYALSGPSSGAVFWMDAGTEVRRPLFRARERTAANGVFAIQHQRGFPNGEYHFEECVRRNGCKAEKGERAHCATTLIGLYAGDRATRKDGADGDEDHDDHDDSPLKHGSVAPPPPPPPPPLRAFLGESEDFSTPSYVPSSSVPLASFLSSELLRCCAVATCVNPLGSNRGNHRQEQTVLNAIMCREGIGERRYCTDDWNLRASAEFEHDWGDGPFVTTDEEQWKNIEIYTRRVHPVKPYVRHLKYK